MSSDDDDDDDYMSDKFCTANTDNDVRPGLIHSRPIQREIQMASKKRQANDHQRVQTKSAKVLEHENRETGLNNAIPTAGNKGFAMMARMGYVQGNAIGKSSTAGDAILEPLNIQLKSDRGGLGREAALQQLKERKEQIRQKKKEKAEPEVTIEAFRQRMTEKTQGKQLDADLGKCQRACESLDLKENIEVPAMPWFWPLRQVAEEATDEDDPSDPESEEANSDKEENDDSTDDEKLFKYHKRRNDKAKTATAKTLDAHEDGEGDELIIYETSEKLEMLTTYLRTTYCYCHWCGTHYTDVEDLMATCPGQSKDEH